MKGFQKLKRMATPLAPRMAIIYANRMGANLKTGNHSLRPRLLIPLSLLEPAIMNRTSPWTTQPRHLVRPRPTAIPLQGPHWKAMLVRLCLTFATCLIASSPLSAQGNDDKPRARRMPVQPAPVMPSADSAGWQSLFNVKTSRDGFNATVGPSIASKEDCILGRRPKEVPIHSSAPRKIITILSYASKSKSTMP